MIISRIYNKLNNKQKENFVESLVFGLVSGLVGGLIAGLVAGLIAGLVGGLVFGLVFGLVGGLVWGLVVILVNFSEALPFFASFPEWLFLIIGIIIISEIMFFLMPKERLNKKVNVFWHTAKRKLENIFEVLLGFSLISQIYILIRELNVYFNYELFQETLKWIGYIGIGVIGLVLIAFLFYIWIKLNSLKYEK